MKDHDTLQRFLFEKADVRGEIVRLNASYKAIVEGHKYPNEVNRILGEALAVVALLSATIKHQGFLTLQLQGDGPLSLVVAQSNEFGNVRGFARFDGEVSTEFRHAVGNGRIALSIDPGNGKQPYQAVVEMKGDSLAECLEHYFDQSEQIVTHIYIVQQAHEVAGLLLQILPSENEGSQKQDWNELRQLANTLRQDEFLSVANEDLLYRLFHQHNLRLFETEPVNFRCTCSQESIEDGVRTLGYEDVQKLLTEKGAVKVSCEFCSRSYQFDPVDVESIFKGGVNSEEDTKH